MLLILKKLGKHDDKIPSLYSDTKEGRAQWELLKQQFQQDEEAKKYYDCELWEKTTAQAGVTNFRYVDSFKGYYA